MKLLTNVDFQKVDRQQVPELLNLENQKYSYCRAPDKDLWQEKDFYKVLRMPYQESQFALLGKNKVGFFMCRLNRDSVQIMNLVVSEAFRRQGIGTQIINRIKYNLLSGQRKSLEIFVKETNLYAHLFLKENGFLAEEVASGFFDDIDGYKFVYRKEK